MERRKIIQKPMKKNKFRREKGIKQEEREKGR
jgi:hypothetical protein